MASNQIIPTDTARKLGCKILKYLNFTTTCRCRYGSRVIELKICEYITNKRETGGVGVGGETGPTLRGPMKLFSNRNPYTVNAFVAIYMKSLASLGVESIYLSSLPELWHSHYRKALCDSQRSSLT